MKCSQADSKKKLSRYQTDSLSPRNLKKAWQGLCYLFVFSLPGIRFLKTLTGKYKGQQLTQTLVP